MNKNEKRVRFNIVDLIVLIVIVCAVAVIAVSHFLSKDSGNGEMKTVEFTFYAESVDDTVVNTLEKGQAVSEGYTEAFFGNILDLKFGESISYLDKRNVDGSYSFVTAKQSEYSSVTIKSVVDCKFTDLGVMIDGKLYGVGHTLELLAGDTRFTARIRDISVVGE